MNRRISTKLPSCGPARQGGAALIVGLILMLVLTTLGISGMRTATLELTMANNVDSQQDAFQAAETGIDATIGQGNYTTVGQTVVNMPLGDGSYSTNAVTINSACTFVPDSASSTGTIGAYHFDITSVGNGPRGANSTHTQSFYVRGPACP